LQEGAVVGEKYRVVRTLGQGGMGVVYEALNTWTRQPVALKFPTREGRARETLSEASVARLLCEAQAAARIRHPHVVQVYDVGRDADGQVFLVQELLRGHPLAEELRQRGALPLSAARAMLLPVMEGLDRAHSLGVVHRDLKPENLLVLQGDDGEVLVKVLDFGVARLLDDDPDARLTADGAAVGTPAFMAPEQARGEAVDARADVWAMALVWAEALSGRRVFEGHRNAVLAQVLTGRVSLPPMPGVPASVQAALTRALSPKRDDRWPTMAAFAAALREGAPPATPTTPRLLRGPAWIGLVLLLVVAAWALHRQTQPARPLPTPTAPARQVPRTAPAIPAPPSTVTPSSVPPTQPVAPPPQPATARPLRPLRRGATPTPPSAPSQGANHAPILEP
jgi:serine/threonine protein kinase